MKRKYEYDVNSFTLITPCLKKRVMIGSLICQKCEYFKRKNHDKQFVICKGKTK